MNIEETLFPTGLEPAAFHVLWYQSPDFIGGMEGVHY